MRQPLIAALGLGLVLTVVAASAADFPGGEQLKGAFEYDDFEKAETCASCHVDIYQQWTQSMMSQAYTHEWDEIEYFQLAVPHSENDPDMAGVHEGCNGCHAPLAFMAGELPPPLPEEGSRANEAVTCDVCHTINGRVAGADTSFNFNWTIDPGRTKYGNKPGVESPHHDTMELDFIQEAEYCGTCHNEKSPFGVWVKSTQLEWAEGPYAAEGVPCHTCHMPVAHDTSAKMAEPDMVSQHLFHGAHDEGKLKGSIEMRMHPKQREVLFDEPAVVEVQLFNGKCGHKIPSGSVEDRIMWLHVTATDSEGKVHHLPVDEKGFEGEETTIAADVLAYQDMAVPLDDPDFEGVQRDGVPVGDRIFRKAYFDPQGRMTIMQWNTASFGPDYRIGPRETKLETYTWRLPDDIPLGKVTFEATLNYKLLVEPVGKLLDVPASEYETVVINTTNTWIEIFD